MTNDQMEMVMKKIFIDGMEWNEVNEVEWDEMKWNEVEWSGVGGDKACEMKERFFWKI